MDVNTTRDTMQPTKSVDEVRKWLLSMKGRDVSDIEWNQVWTSYLATLNYIDGVLGNRPLSGFDRIVEPEHPLYRKDYF